MRSEEQKDADRDQSTMFVHCSQEMAKREKGMKVKHYARENSYAVTDTDEHSPVVIEWHMDNKPTGAACDGWIEGEGLFAPPTTRPYPATGWMRTASQTPQETGTT